MAESFILEDVDGFKHILRVMNTNLVGRIQAPFAFTKISGIGRRFAILVCKKARIPLNIRAGELSDEQVEKVTSIINDPEAHGIPGWFLNRRSNFKTAKKAQVT